MSLIARVCLSLLFNQVFFPDTHRSRVDKPSSQFEQLVCLIQIELAADVPQSLITRFALSFLLRLEKSMYSTLFAQFGSSFKRLKSQNLAYLTSLESLGA